MKRVITCIAVVFVLCVAYSCADPRPDIPNPMVTGQTGIWTTTCGMAQHHRAMVAFKKDRFEEVLQHVNEGLEKIEHMSSEVEKLPLAGYAYYRELLKMRGGTNFALEKYDDARSDYIKYIALYPNDWVGHYNLAQLCMLQGKLAEADAPLRMALKLEPDEGKIRDLLKRYIKDKKKKEMRDRINEELRVKSEE